MHTDNEIGRAIEAQRKRERFLSGALTELQRIRRFAIEHGMRRGKATLLAIDNLIELVERWLERERYYGD